VKWLKWWPERAGFLLFAGDQVGRPMAKILEGDETRSKFYWTGCNEGTAGGGIIIAEKFLITWGKESKCKADDDKDNCW